MGFPKTFNGLLKEYEREALAYQNNISKMSNMVVVAERTLCKSDMVCFAFRVKVMDEYIYIPKGEGAVPVTCYAYIETVFNEKSRTFRLCLRLENTGDFILVKPIIELPVGDRMVFLPLVIDFMRSYTAELARKNVIVADKVKELLSMPDDSEDEMPSQLMENISDDSDYEMPSQFMENMS
jgi:hypothetical protein